MPFHEHHLAPPPAGDTADRHAEFRADQDIEIDLHAAAGQRLLGHVLPGKGRPLRPRRCQDDQLRPERTTDHGGLLQEAPAGFAFLVHQEDAGHRTPGIWTDEHGQRLTALCLAQEQLLGSGGQGLAEYQ